MEEIFTNISNNVKQTADSIWRMAYNLSEPLKATQFIDNALKYYAHFFDEHEMQFIDFYIRMKLEELRCKQP